MVRVLLVLLACLGSSLGCVRPKPESTAVPPIEKPVDAPTESVDFQDPKKPADQPKSHGERAPTPDQPAIERKYIKLSNDVSEAVKTGNNLLVKDKRAELSKFWDETFQVGRELNNWIGVMGDIGETTIRIPQQKDGQPLPDKEVTALVVSVWLRDPGESQPTNDRIPGGDYPAVLVRVTTYDPASQSSIDGFEKVFRELRSGKLARFSGKIHSLKLTVQDFQGLDRSPAVSVTVTRIEPLDLKVARADALRRLNNSAIVEELAGMQHAVTHPRDFIVHAGQWADNTPISTQYHYCCDLAYHYPDYRKAVVDYNAFEPIDEGSIDRWSKERKAAIARLETRRFLDEGAELKQARGLETSIRNAHEKIKRGSDEANLIRKYCEGYTDETNKITVPESFVHWNKFPEEMKKELRIDRQTYVPLPFRSRKFKEKPVPFVTQAIKP